MRDSSDSAQKGNSAEMPFTTLKNLIPKLGAENVRMKNPVEVLSKLRILIAGGLRKLQVISDFDYTLSRYHYHGTKCQTCYGAILESKLFPAEIGAQFEVLKDRYYPIEISPEMTVEQKLPYMVEWWTEAYRLFVEGGISREMIKESAKTANVKLRCGTEEMFDVLRKNSVPMLVLSAGIGDVIEELLRREGPIPPNVHVIGNRLEFDSEGKGVRRKGVMIHTLNKNETAVHHSNYFEDLSHRHNVLLLGDVISDGNMADGVVDPNVIFKIGFLNHTIDERLNVYLDTFDVVLLDDQTMDLPNKIIQTVGAQ